MPLGGAPPAGGGRISSCTREPAVELAVPLDVAAEADGQAASDHLEASAHRVARVPCAIDLGHHLDLDLGVHAAKRRIGADGAHILVRDRERIGERRRSDRDHVAHDVDAELLEQLPRDGADGDPCGRLAGARALEHVANVVMAVFHDPGEVGMAWTGARDGRPLGA